MNLKTAARQLGVHYQTAYKWVRSGELIAVKVGLSYEISEAALERFLLDREAQKRVPTEALERNGHGSALTPLGVADREHVLAELDAMLPYVSVDARALFDHLVWRATETIGDSVVLRLLSEDRRWSEPVAFGHPDPAKHVIMGAILARHLQRADEGFAGRALAEERTFFMPQVSQRAARRGVPSEFVQYFDLASVYSVIVGVLRRGDEPAGTLTVHRTQPGAPYNRDDVAYLEQLAARASSALSRADLFERAWRARADLKARIESLVVAAGGRPIDAAQLTRQLTDVDDRGLGLVLTDLGHRVVAISVRAAASLGYEPGELVGMSCLELTAPEDLPDEKEHLARMVRGELDYCDVSVRKLHRDGRAVPLAVHRAVARTPDGTPHFVVAALRPDCGSVH
ncbi:MAG TPA: PAS domain S-box protein [Acidimicrobiia bacterium]|nr:PAS domain S-box protein [Acidimicrobiia bacterium]